MYHDGSRNSIHCWKATFNLGKEGVHLVSGGLFFSNVYRRKLLFVYLNVDFYL